jgi:hypothetical protein
MPIQEWIGNECATGGHDVALPRCNSGFHCTAREEAANADHRQARGFLDLGGIILIHPLDLLG